MFLKAALRCPASPRKPALRAFQTPFSLPQATAATCIQRKRKGLHSPADRWFAEEKEAFENNPITRPAPVPFPYTVTAPAQMAKQQYAAASFQLSAGIVLPICDCFHPVRAFAIFDAGNGNMGHGCIRGSAMPVFHGRRAPHFVSCPDFSHPAVFCAGKPLAGCHYQMLPGNMGMPEGAGTRLKGDTGGCIWCLLTGLEDALHTHTAGKGAGRRLGWRIRSGSGYGLPGTLRFSSLCSR